MTPPGPKATLKTIPSLTANGSGRSLPPRASISTTPPTAAEIMAVDAVPRGDDAAGAEGHAVDTALPDHDRLGAQPLPLGVQHHHAADDAIAPPYP